VAISRAIRCASVANSVATITKTIGNSIVVSTCTTGSDVPLEK
jgi:hypothetical protein